MIGEGAGNFPAEDTGEESDDDTYYGNRESKESKCRHE